MPPITRISVAMPPDLLQAVEESVAAGDYASTAEALRDAVRVWKRQRLSDAERLHAIRMRIRRSLDDPRHDLSSDAVDGDLAEILAQAERNTERA